MNPIDGRCAALEIEHRNVAERCWHKPHMVWRAIIFDIGDNYNVDVEGNVTRDPEDSMLCIDIIEGDTQEDLAAFIQERYSYITLAKCGDKIARADEISVWETAMAMRARHWNEGAIKFMEESG